MKLYIGMLAGGILAVTNPTARDWFARAWDWIQAQLPHITDAVRSLIG